MFLTPFMGLVMGYDEDYAHVQELIINAYNDHLEELKWDWSKLARPNQLPPQDYDVWLVLAGRGFGKTRMGAELVRSWVEVEGFKRIALVGETEHDVRGVMVEGESGLLNIGPPSKRPEYFPSLRRLVWSNGAVAEFFASTHVEGLRGPQFHGAWVDEIAKFKNPKEVYDQLNFTLRLGPRPKMIITTTPKPIGFLKGLMLEKGVVTTRGSSFENAKNLSPNFLARFDDLYAHTDLRRQEVEGEILSQHSLFKREWFRYN